MTSNVAENVTFCNSYVINGKDLPRVSFKWNEYLVKMNNVMTEL